jgi:hypothetical protein
MEASGHARWFERLLGELRFALWIGDAAEISDFSACSWEAMPKITVGLAPGLCAHGQDWTVQRGV